MFTDLIICTAHAHICTLCCTTTTTSPLMMIFDFNPIAFCVCVFRWWWWALDSFSFDTMQTHTSGRLKFNINVMLEFDEFERGRECVCAFVRGQNMRANGNFCRLTLYLIHKNSSESCQIFNGYWTTVSRRGAHCSRTIHLIDWKYESMWIRE